MLSLSKIFLYNWHRFKDHTLEVEDGLFLCGLNGSGKSSVLDALQMVLVADLQKTKFNSSAQDKTTRNLDGYVRGKMGEDRFLRKGNAVSFVAVEFRSTKDPESFVTLGICIEAGPERHPERSWFVQKRAFDKETFFEDGVPLTRKELKSYFRKKGLGDTFDQVSEYQPALLKAIGGLGEQFFDLFMKSLTFLPLRDVRAFVEQWLLEKAPLDVENLRSVSERLSDLHGHCTRMQSQIVQLDRVEALQQEVLRLKQLQTDYTSVKLHAERADFDQKRESVVAQIHEKSAEKEKLESSLSDMTLVISEASQKELDLQLTLASSEVGRQKLQMERDIQKLSEIRQTFQNRRNAFGRRKEEFFRGLGKFEDSDPVSKDLANIRTWLSFERPHEQGDTSGPEEVSLNSAVFSKAQSPVDLLRQMRDQKVEETALVKHRLSQSLNRVREIEGELAKLKGGQKARPPRQAEELRRSLESELSCSCPFLYELLEVREERWQNAVEAMLGARRFLIVVPEDQYERASEVLEYQRREKGLTDAAILDTASVKSEASQRNNNSVSETSLAAVVHVDRLDLRSYLRLILGEIQRVNSVKDLRKHRRAITSECVLYSEWSVRAIPKHRFEPWFLGVRASQSQEKKLKEEGKEISAQVARDNEILSQSHAILKVYDCLPLIQETSELRSLAAEDKSNSARLEKLRAEILSLDFSSLEQIQQSLSHCKAEIAKLRADERRTIEDLSRVTEQVSRLSDESVLLNEQLLKCVSNLDDWSLHQPESSARGQVLFEEKSRGASLGAVSKNADLTAKSYETRAINETQKLVEAATAFNIGFQFAGNPADPNETRYTVEKQRLVATALPQYKAQIEAEQRRAEQELREHILHRLREKIVGARSQLEGVNRSLKGLQFNEESYRFRWYPADDLREFYDLIVEARQIGTTSLLESDWYLKNQQSFDRFYEMLTSVPQTDSERRALERLTDYRSYLTYDIEVTHANGQVSRLSKIIGQTSGGETQTPFYITIAASFLQLYSAREKLGHECPRLICFDEAFSKMDQERIAATLDAFQKFNLQVLIATPLERSEYIVPKIKTSLVVTAVEDGVVVEPYRNYLASLEDLVLEHVEDAEASEIDPQASKILRKASKISEVNAKASKTPSSQWD